MNVEADFGGDGCDGGAGVGLSEAFGQFGVEGVGGGRFTVVVNYFHGDDVIGGVGALILYGASAMMCVFGRLSWWPSFNHQQC